MSSDINTDSIHEFIQPNMQQTSMLHIYYMPRYVPDGGNRKMSDILPDMNCSAPEGAKQKLNQHFSVA